MDILVLLKAVPLVGTERLDPGWRTVRDQLEPNGADEYVLEKALRLTEVHGGEVSLLTMGPAAASEALRKGLAMGAQRAWHVLDAAIEGSDIRASLTVLEAAAKRIDFDLLFCGAETSDGQGGVMGAALAARLGLPCLSAATEVTPDPAGRSVRVQRLAPGGLEVVEAAMPAVVVGTQLLGAPRYPSLRGIMAARSREIVTWSLADLGLDAGTAGTTAATTRVLSSEAPPPRARAEVLSGDPDAVAAGIVDFLAARGIL